jgi:hypothetical protein
VHRGGPGARHDRGEPGRLTTALATVAGVAAITIALRDVFDALFHPEGRGVLSRAIMRAGDAALRPFVARRRQAVAVVGPLSLLAVIGTWTLLLALGWALILWPHIDSFRSIAGGDPGFVEAVYVSLLTLATLGFGDISPTEDWLRLVAPIEALLGLGLLTASISWLLTLYPALYRRRSLAYEIALLRKTERDLEIHVSELDAGAAEGIYADLTSRLVAVERDLVAFPVTHYFQEADERFSLAAAIPFLRELVESGEAAGVPERVRFRAAMLREAVDDFARSVRAV